ncbi:DUF3883 domain-containing protein [Mucilaginibacter roseus]|uniref:DUF3883 domain-containing protein n=1 Tax=Mucilaginibacter roseus TaxID=1528868 RepID=A0ABS8U0M0_9SPHI|nr:DUF3883 domain-containing protein [Mucilaginibacter roseus]MCD8739058.1 DUF3883 domain-containing protein [Mucilaginibacter roseus]
MEGLAAFIHSELTKRVIDYTNSPDYIIEHFQAEQRNIESYNGRQLLEMLQNADDASGPAKNKKALIRLDNNVLTISNNGEAFTKEGYRSLFYLHRSHKPMQKNKIGQKGLGFRSVLSWAEHVEIESGGSCVGFSERYATDFLQMLINKDPGLLPMLKSSTPNIGMAILRVPKLLEAEVTEPVYQTTIRLTLKPHVLKDVQDQIDTIISAETMLFLNHLDEIEIDSPGRSVIFSRRKKAGKVTVTTNDRREKKQDSKTWNVQYKSGKRKSKQYELSLAWTDGLDDTIGTLFSFFKTDVKLPFPGLVHGTFELTDDRNNLIIDTEGHNEFLIEQLAALLVVGAQKIAAEDKPSYKPLQLLNIDFEKVDKKLETLGLKSALRSRIKEHALFPTVNGKYIKVADEPVYCESPIPEILQGEGLDELLLSTTDATLASFVKSFFDFYYLLTSFTGFIADRLHQLSVAKIARLIHYVITNPNYKEDLRSPKFKLDDCPPFLPAEDMRAIPWTSRVFLPNGEKQAFTLPDEVKVAFLNNDVSNAFLQVFEVDDLSAVSSKLNVLGLHQYSFADICQLLIDHYHEDDKKQVQELHQYLFPIFKKELVPEPLTRRVRVVTAKGNTAWADDTYLGIEFGNALAQQLYAHDKNRLLGVFPSQQAANLSRHISYALWLGCLKMPKYRIVNLNWDDPNTEQYADFATRAFDFKKQIADYGTQFKDYSQFEQELRYLKHINVGQFDDMPRILAKVRPATLFLWLKEDDRLRKVLEDPFESSANARITFELKGKSSDRTVPHRQIRNYTKWLIAHTAWLPVESGRKAEPARCCLSKTITKQYSPYVEKPMLKTAQLAEQLSIAETVVETMLVSCGVHQEISTFGMDTLYDMLTSLPESDTAGSAAPALYREIIKNYDVNRLDASHAAYQQFLKNGKVLCHLGKQRLYVPVGEAFYIHTKSYGDNLLKRFPLINIDRKSGSIRVRKLFGVQPLEKITFQFRSAPTLHFLNNQFQEEFNHFKALVYVLRMDLDTRNDSHSRIKRMRVQLVTAIEATYQFKNGEPEDFELDAHEFVNLRTEFYLKISEDYRSLDDLRESIEFADALAEIFTAVLPVEEHRSFIRELYRVRRSRREELLLKELDENNNFKIVRARKILDIVDDLRLSFWQAFQLALPKPTKADIRDEQSLQRYFSKNLALDPALSVQLAEPEHYNNLTELETEELFYPLFQQFRVNFSIFNRHFSGIDFVHLFKDRLEDLKRIAAAEFNASLYEQLRTTTVNEQKKYFQTVDRYDHLGYDPADSYVSDMAIYFKALVSGQLKIDLSLKPSDFNANTLIADSINELLQNGVQFSEIFLLKKEVQSLLIFRQFQALMQLFEEFKSKEPETRTGEQGNGQRIKIGDKIIDFDNYVSLAEQALELVDLTKFKLKPSKTEAIETGGGPKGKSGGKSGSRKVIFGSAGEEQIGFVAELYAKYALQNRFGGDNVQWVSENAYRAEGKFSSEAGKGYDFEVTDHDRLRYIEVKAVMDVTSGFKMTDTEMAKALALPEKYDLLIIENILSGKPSFRYLRSPFRFKKEESLLDNPQFTVTNDNYIVRLRWAEPATG